jgi:lipoprotein-anchoring transpeptidase ErfK/SrfK
VPAGRTWIRVDLDTQLISVFRAGHEIGTAVILYGADGVPTPTGHFPILAKLKDHRSSTYDGAPMPYTLRLTADGVSIHGSNVRWGFATHGCVGVPTTFAAKLFQVVKKGDEVVIVNSAPRKSAA